jgi:hypothetical protein
MSAEQQKVTIKIPKGYDPDDFEQIGKDVIDFIRERSQSGVGVRKRGSGFQTYDFPDYSDDYAKRKGSTRVDLTLSEQMLDEIEVLKVSKDSITIGFRAGTDVNAKAEGNQTGSYGRDRPNPRKARRFLGITGEELDAVLGAFDREGD